MARLSTIYVSLGAAALLSACVARPLLVPAGGAQYAVAAQNNVSIMSSGGEWPGDDSVYDYLTPLAVDIHNGSDETIVVSYKDFSLANDHGFHYSALNPFLHDGNEEGDQDGDDDNDGDMQDDTPRVAPPAAPRSQPSSRPSGGSTMLDPPDVTLALATDDASLVFVRGGGGGGGHGGGGGGHGGGGSHGGFGGGHGSFGGHGGVSGHYGYGGGHYGYGGHGYYGRGYGYGRGFRGGFGGARGFYGWRWGWGGWPWWGVPYYYYWGTPYYYYYGRQVPPSEIPRYALAEGVIKPGGDVHGFLYFQRATDRSHRLTLEWAVHEPGGAETAFLKVKLDVVHD